MILVTGGLGFIGVHTVRALLDRGEACVVTRHRSSAIPPFLAAEVGRRVWVEDCDVRDPESWAAVGRSHEIAGIIHLAGWGVPPGRTEDLRADLSPAATLNALQAARDWGVARVTLASSIGVYAGVPAGSGPVREDRPLPLVGHHAIETAKKVDELLGTLTASALGVDAVCCRIAGIWGPLGRPRSRFFSLPQLVHAAVRGPGAGLEPPPYADDGGELLFVADCARALALLHTAPRLRHRTYNVGSGRLTTNADVADAIARILPERRPRLRPGRDPANQAPAVVLDLDRLRSDTGFEPAFDLDRGVAAYVAWLRDGHER